MKKNEAKAQTSKEGLNLGTLVKKNLLSLKRSSPLYKRELQQILDIQSQTLGAISDREEELVESSVQEIVASEELEETSEEIPKKKSKVGVMNTKKGKKVKNPKEPEFVQPTMSSSLTANKDLDLGLVNPAIEKEKEEPKDKLKQFGKVFPFF